MIIFPTTQPHSPNWAAVLTGVWRGVPGHNAPTWSHLWFHSTGTELKVFPPTTPVPHQHTGACNQPRRGHSKHPLNLPESLVSYQFPFDPLRAFLRLFLASPFTKTLLWSRHSTHLCHVGLILPFQPFANWFAEFHTMIKYTSRIPKQFEEVFFFFFLNCYRFATKGFFDLRKKSTIWLNQSMNQAFSPVVTKTRRIGFEFQHLH